MAATAPTLVARLAAAFPRQELRPTTVQTYLADLAPIPAATLEAAITKLIRTEEWFPTIQKIRAACAELTLGLPSETDALAQIDRRIEWGRDRFAEAPASGAGSAPELHPLVREALDSVGGWAAFRGSEEPGRVRRSFAMNYAQLRADAIRSAQLADSIGGATRPQIAA